MKTVYFIRHGESDTNASGVIRGTDAQLTEQGKKQATKVAERFRTIEHEVVVTSTYPRAYDTARAVADVSGRPLVTCEHLHERVTPSINVGRHYDDPERRAVELAQYEHWAHGDHAYRHSDEEAFEELRSRALRARTWIEEREESSLVVVTHGVFLRLFQATVLFGDSLTSDVYLRFLFGFKTSNAGITIFEIHPEQKYAWDIQWKLRTWMDVAHLGD